MKQESPQARPESTKRDVLLRLVNVDRVYSMGEVAVQVLRGVSFDVYEGEFLVIVGPSGSGKTTILNLVGGLDQPTAGSIAYRGRDITRLSPRAMTAYRREEIGFVFQFYNLVPTLTARENVQAATEICSDPLDVDHTLELVGLAQRSDHFPAQLSGGEQQRVAIARAVAKNPALLLCDEPTGALDFETGKKVLRLLVDLNREYHKTVAVITHNTALAGVADRVIHLRSGTVSEIVEHAEPIAPEDVVW